jgi:hypothetical protein
LGEEEGQMVIAHVVIGLCVGALAAVTSLALGYSFWSAVGFYLLGSSLGTAGVIPLLLLGQLLKADDVLSSGAIATEGEYRQAS